MNDLAARLRQAARERLPEGAFLRRDRGAALFATDAPRCQPDGGWVASLAEAGFVCAIDGGLARLTPGASWLSRLEAAHPAPPDFLCETMLRFAGRPSDARALALFALGARALDGGDPIEAAAFDRGLRRHAAAALRENNQYGGGLYACALLKHLIDLEGGKS